MPRAALVARVDEVLAAKVTLLQAPAGYGKTTVLAQWQEEILSRGARVAWLSLDDHDQDLFQFLTYLVESLKVSGARTNAGIALSETSYSGSPPRALIEAVITELKKCRGLLVLMLDDLHRAMGREVGEVINRMLAALPENVRLVLSTREYPKELSLADLRMHDNLAVFDQPSLKFDEGEIKSYLGAIVESDADDQWAKDLLAKTEGWPIALKAVRQWINEGATMVDTLADISGKSADLSDYFFEQVFDTLEPEYRDFLLSTSILERVNGDLANVLCGIENAWEILENLEQKDLFVHSLDRERTWYRYHRLFSEFLQERQRRQSETNLRELHRKASGWFHGKGHKSEAVQHAMQSRHATTIAGLLEKLGGWHYALEGHVGVFERAFALVDGSEVEKFPRLWQAKIFLTARKGEIEVAERMLNSFRSAIGRNFADDQELHSEAIVMQSLLSVYADHDATDEEVERLERLGEVFAVENDVMNAARCNLLCAKYAQLGRFGECADAGDRAITHFRSMGSVWGESFIYFHEGYACLLQGRIREADVLYRVGYDLAVENFGIASDLAAIGSAFLAEVAYERNNIQEAKKYLKVALPHIERFDAWLEVYLAAYTTRLKIARINRNTRDFRQTVGRAVSIATNRGIPRLKKIIETMAFDIEQRDRNAKQLPEVESALAVNLADMGNLPALKYAQTCAEARQLLGNDKMGEAILLLEEVGSRFKSARFVKWYVSLTVLLATAYWRDGQLNTAVSTFEKALVPAIFESLKRPFIDEGAALIEVLRALTKNPERNRGNRLRDKFLAELVMEITSENVEVKPVQSVLSPREREVIRYLVQGRSNREIADAVAISINTVKFHIKNIFDKLDVYSRKDAVTASIHRGLLD